MPFGILEKDLCISPMAAFTKIWQFKETMNDYQQTDFKMEGNETEYRMVDPNTSTKELLNLVRKWETGN